MRSAALFVLLAACAGHVEDDVVVEGFAREASAHVRLSARNPKTGDYETVATAAASASADASGRFRWSAKVAPRFDRESTIVGGAPRTLNGLATGGRFDLVASGGCIASGATCSPELVFFERRGAEATRWVSDIGATVPGVAWELGHYVVQDRVVWGLVCRPTTPGRYPAAIINHGGFDGIDDAALTTCVASAEAGWLTAMSGYRGEGVRLSPSSALPDGVTREASGTIELCLGEVLDVLRLTEIVRARDDVDPERVLMWGHSHGACVTLGAVARGARVRAAAAFAAPTDMAAWYDAADAQTKSAISLTFGSPQEDLRVTPSQTRAPYDWRSPLRWYGDVDPSVRIAVFHGSADAVVGVDQAIALADAWGVPPRSVAESWSAQRHVLVYEGATHATILERAWNDFSSFVASTF